MVCSGSLGGGELPLVPSIVPLLAVSVMTETLVPWHCPNIANQAEAKLDILNLTFRGKTFLALVAS